MALSCYFKNINLFEYFEEFNCIDKNYVEELLKEVFDENKKVISITKPVNEEWVE